MAFDQMAFNTFIMENDVCGFAQEEITLVSGRKTRYYFNWRNVLGDVWLTEKLCDAFIGFSQAQGLAPDTFYGVPEGATKLGIMAQYKWAHLSKRYAKGSHALAMGRAKPKDHGMPKDKYFVGIPRGKVVVVEDVTTTGLSLLGTLDRLAEADVEVIAVISLTNRMELRDDGKSVKDMIEARGPKFYTMSSSLELLPALYRKQKPGEAIGRAIEAEFERCGVEKLKLL